MTKKYDLFTIYNFNKLYAGTADKVKTIISSDLEYDELVLVMKDRMLDIKDFEPALLISKEQEMPILDYKRNDEKFLKRQQLYEDFYGFEEDKTEAMHMDAAVNVDFVELIMQEETEKLNKLYEALKSLTELQKQRVYMHFFKGMSIAAISKIENRS